MLPEKDGWLVAPVTMAAAAGVAGGVLYWAIDKIKYANGRLVFAEKENDALRAEHERIRTSYHGLISASCTSDFKSARACCSNARKRSTSRGWFS